MKNRGYPDQVLKHQFVDFIPDELQEKTLYVSTRFCTVVHKCVCGCGNEVVTPLSPADWLLTFDGESISLSPSIGSWSLNCQSHYWIRKNRVIWAPRWNREEIEQGRSGSKALKDAYFLQSEVDAAAQGPPLRVTWFRRLRSTFNRWTK